MMTLETPRLTLRKVVVSDAEFLIALRRDADVRRYLGGPMTLDDATTMTQLDICHPRRMFIARRRDKQDPIGLVQLHAGHEGTEISYQLLPSSWSQGFAAEAVRRVIDHAFDTEGISELLAVTQTANKRSRRLLERLGLTASKQFEEFGEPQTLYTARRPA